MDLQFALRRFSLLPRFIQNGNEEPRKAHFLGKREASEVEGKQDQGRKNDQVPKKPTSGKYRSLESIAIGDVEQVIEYYKHQLVPSPAESWVAKNYFCQIPLKRKGEERPLVVFGRVKTNFPGEGYVQNIEELEMYFPRFHTAPDVLHLLPDDIAMHKPVYSFCIGVKMYLSEEEQADFSRSENIFVERGFAPLYNTGYSELLDIHEQNHHSLPMLYVVGSEWFASIPDSLQPDIRAQLRNLTLWNKALFNYHPKRHTLQYRSLNDELDFNFGFTEHYLMMPQDTNQAMMKVAETFGETFMRGMNIA
jgi:hypothetical protein